MRKKIHKEVYVPILSQQDEHENERKYEHKHKHKHETDSDRQSHNNSNNERKKKEDYARARVNHAQYEDIFKHWCIYTSRHEAHSGPARSQSESMMYELSYNKLEKYSAWIDRVLLSLCAVNTICIFLFIYHVWFVSKFVSMFAFVFAEYVLMIVTDLSGYYYHKRSKVKPLTVSSICCAVLLLLPYVQYYDAVLATPAAAGAEARGRGRARVRGRFFLNSY